MAEQCPRCSAYLPPAGAENLFCPACGLLQLRIAEDAIASHDDEAGGTARATDAVQGNASTDWPLALRIVFLASVMGAVPALLLPGQAATGAVGGLVLVLTPFLTIGSVTLYYRSRRQMGMTGGIGSRLGCVLGMLLGCWVILGTGIAGFVLRYRDHSHLIDDRISEATARLPAQVSPDAPLPAELVARIASPEFRAAMFMLGNVAIVFVFIAVGALCGALAGAALHARRQRHIA